MELNDMEKRMLFQVEGDYQYKVLNELHMAARYTKDPEQRKAAESLMAKLRVLTDDECMDIVRDIQKNYLLPYPPPDDWGKDCGGQAAIRRGKIERA